MPNDENTLYQVWMKLDENWERSRVINTVKLEILQSAPNDPKPKSRNRLSKVSFMYALYYTGSQSFVGFALQSAVFEIFHILGFPIDSHFKISTCHKFCKTGSIAKKSNSLHSPMVSNIFLEFGWDPKKNVGEVAF